MRLRLAALAFLMLLAGTACAVLWHVGTTLAQPPRKTVEAPSDLPVRPFVLDGGGVSSRGWLIEAPDRRGTVILLHGLGDNRLSMLGPGAVPSSRRNYSSLLYDSRAHGESGGEWVTFGAFESEDLRRVLRWRREQHPENRSPSSAPLWRSERRRRRSAARGRCSRHRVRSTPRSRSHGGSSGATSRRWARFFEPLLTLQLAWRLDIPRTPRPVERIAAITAPKLIIAGEADRHTPLAATERIFAAAAPPKDLRLLPEIAHVDLHWADGDEYERRILDFLYGTCEAVAVECIVPAWPTAHF